MASIDEDFLAPQMPCIKWRLLNSQSVGAIEFEGCFLLKDPSNRQCVLGPSIGAIFASSVSIGMKSVLLYPSSSSYRPNTSPTLQMDFCKLISKVGNLILIFKRYG